MPINDADPQDWIYFHFNPELQGIEFRDVGGGLYEQVFVRHPSTDPFIATWYTFPNQNEYAPKDLFSKHPSKPGLWLYEGRSDNVIVFSNGEKFNPNAMEGILNSYPDIRQVLVIGQARFQPAALIELEGEPPLSDEARKSFLDELAPYLNKANDAAPGYAKLQPEYIAFTKADKPMLVADKGTVKRAATLRAYQAEIDNLYADAERLANNVPITELSVHDIDALTGSLQDMMAATIRIDRLEPDQDIFAAGTDSLQVINMVRQLKASLAKAEPDFPIDLISAKVIYSNPKAAQLAKSLHQLATKGDEVYQDLEQIRIQKMKDYLAKFSEDLPKATGQKAEKDDRLTVVLTGSTGSLGSYLIDALLAPKQVPRIICLNRSSDAEEKQKEVNASRDLITDWGNRIRFLKTDLSKPHLGLSSTDYEMLLHDTSYIIRKPNPSARCHPTQRLTICQTTNGKSTSTSPSTPSLPTSPAPGTSLTSAPTPSSRPPSSSHRASRR